jgi:hypothetical protein
VFLVGVLPALLVYWIRRHVPEPAEWRAAKEHARTLAAVHPGGGSAAPGVGDLFHGPVLRTTLLTIGVCACSLTAWWAFMFWHTQHPRSLPEVAKWPQADQERLASVVFFAVIGISIFGNFVAAGIARVIGYRLSIAVMCVGFFLTMYGAYSVPRDYKSLVLWLPWVGFFSGVFGLFTMYLPPLFPTLLRTTGAGFCYNIGRIASAVGIVFFGLFTKVGDSRLAMFYAGFLFVPAAIVAWLLPELPNENAPPPAGPAIIPMPTSVPTHPNAQIRSSRCA